MSLRRTQCVLFIVRINLTCRNFDTEKDASGYYYNFVFHVTSVEEDVIMQSWGDDYSQYATTMDEPDKFIAGQSEYSVGDWNTSGEPVTIGAYAANIKKFDSNGALVESSKEKVGRYVSFRLVDGTLFADGVPDGTPVSLYNLQGICVSKTTVQDGAVSVAGLAKGVYAVQLGRLGSTLIRK